MLDPYPFSIVCWASMFQIISRISKDIGANPGQVEAAVKLLDGGDTVPFIARYRKEATGGLDDTQLRLLSERLVYVRELDARRGAIIESIRGQGNLTEDLAPKIPPIVTKPHLDDPHLPYTPKPPPPPH